MEEPTVEALGFFVVFWVKNKQEWAAHAFGVTWQGTSWDCLTGLHTLEP